MRALRRPVAIVRILAGVVFVLKGALMFSNENFLYGGLMETIDRAGRPFPFYEGVLSSYVDVHQTFFTYLVPSAELAIGLSLLAGAFVSLSTFTGALLIVNYALATCYGAPVRLAELLVVAIGLLMLGWMGAGLTWGLDRWMVRRSRSTLVLLPIRRSVPAFQKSS